MKKKLATLCFLYGTSHILYDDTTYNHLVSFPPSGSLVRPKVVKSVHFCPVTSAFTTREYRDITSNMGLPTGSVYPTRVIYLLLSVS